MNKIEFNEDISKQVEANKLNQIENLIEKKAC